MRKIWCLFIGLSFLLSACEENDMGINKEVLYQKTFESQFGQIAPGHQWGFDRAEAILQAQYELTRDEITRAIIKADEVVLPPNLHTYEVYGNAPMITDKEHNEVFAWFSNHRVYWTNPMTYYNGNPTNQTNDNIAHVIDTSFPDYGSLTTASYNNPLGDYELNAFLDFHHAWVQHVASNENEEAVSICPTGANDEQNYIDRDGQYIKDTIEYKVKANMMDYLRCWGYKSSDVVDEDPLDSNGGWQAHLKDDNSAQGWGYGHQDEYHNGVLVTYADVDRWTYGNSVGSSYPHDKYFIVYLKGDDYEGWYLGFDFESYGNNTSERIQADGICNDWIIKITDVGNTILSNTVRIMCEDLGGTFDMDFNDIVYDIKYESNHLCTITVQAAGGTLPLQMKYGDLLLEKNELSEIHALFGANVNQPVNVAAQTNGVTKSAFSWVLAFNGHQSDAQFDYEINEDLVDFSQINVYKNEEGAEWIPIGYKNGTAPYKFAVPEGTRWLKEFQNVIWGYPSFDDWVANPTVEFWNASDIVSSYLY